MRGLTSDFQEVSKWIFALFKNFLEEVGGVKVSDDRPPPYPLF